MSSYLSTMASTGDQNSEISQEMSDMIFLDTKPENKTESNKYDTV